MAIAVEPSLGQLGFWFVTFAAFASTSSAINATLYGTARASYERANDVDLLVLTDAVEREEKERIARRQGKAGIKSPALP